MESRKQFVTDATNRILRIVGMLAEVKAGTDINEGVWITKGREVGNDSDVDNSKDEFMFQSRW